MSTHEPNSHDPRPDDGAASADRRLWRRVASPPAGPCPDPLAFAAYLDRRLPEGGSTEIESHVAACPECRAAVRELRAILETRDESAFALSPAAIAAAKALVPPSADSHAHAAGPAVITVPRLRLRWPVVARFGMAAAASIVVCLIGFRTGTASFVTDHRVDADLVHEMSFGLVDDGGADDADDELALFALGLDASGQEGTP